MSGEDDVLYSEAEGVATVTLNRPEAMNAIRVGMYERIAEAVHRGGWDRNVGVIVLTGAGDRAFCVGGDSGDRKSERRGKGVIGVPLYEVHAAIRDVPKPVIARVSGYAIGGGNVLAALCDLTIACESARFGEVGPRVGSVDCGFGTAYLARIVGEKKAREICFLCRRYTAQEALAMGLVNAVVPDDRLDAEVRRACDDALMASPTALAISKATFNADSDHIKGIAQLGSQAVALYYGSEEAAEAARAFKDKRRPAFRAPRAT